MNMNRLTKRNYYRRAYVPGYAPQCKDNATMELLCKVTERLAVFEDMLERDGVLDNVPDEAVRLLRDNGIIK